MIKKFIILILIIVFVIGISYAVNLNKLFGKIFNAKSDTNINTKLKADPGPVIVPPVTRKVPSVNNPPLILLVTNKSSEAET